jgi:hypothetical protein
LHGLAVLTLSDHNLYTDSRFPARGALRAAAIELNSVQAHRLEFIFPRVGDRRVLGIGEHDR